MFMGIVVSGYDLCVARVHNTIPGLNFPKWINVFRYIVMVKQRQWYSFFLFEPVGRHTKKDWLLHISLYFTCFQFTIYLLFLAWEPMPLLLSIWCGPNFRTEPRTENYDLSTCWKAASIWELVLRSWLSERGAVRNLELYQMVESKGIGSQARKRR